MFTELLEKVVRHEDLTADEAAAAMREVMEGRAAPAALAALLSALVMKGERPSEIVGFARTMREHAVKLSAPVSGVFDTCGTGGDRSGTFNISSAAAVVVAACGVRVAKHGNRSVSSRSGSADVFEALGVNVTAAPAVVERCLTEAGIGFFFAPTFHPSMRHAAQARRALGVRPAFNLLGPLTRPAGAPGAVRPSIVATPNGRSTVGSRSPRRNSVRRHDEHGNAIRGPRAGHRRSPRDDRRRDVAHGRGAGATRPAVRAGRAGGKAR